ncbi:DUF523 domain-containing protein [Actinomadura harenae]|uniref:DUF523 domain-containing protein n=1 Tax=Actinomadura harenae TaxID=2483351 RepID=A0A3M2LUJ5_9ACTN|nr:DUF523 domain-containing protein [Actinomadura harenae]RMI40570.1 DUF523 domain-containing protein [Actinomadura harenae]
MERILVSSCLLGRPVRYDATAKPVSDDLFERWRAEGRLVPVCPEISGGLPVPRPPAELMGAGREPERSTQGPQIMTASGEDVTEEFLRGAQIALETARRAGTRIAILKESSPSCGSHRVYDGTFSGTQVPGMGVTAALLTSAGIRVFSEDDLPEAAAYLAELES